MKPEDASQIGYIVLMVGIALSFIGYAIYLNIRGEKGEKAADEKEDDSVLEAEGLEVSSSEDLDIAVQDEKPSEGLGEKDDDEEALDPVDAGSEATPEGEESESMEEDEDEATPVIPEDPELIPAATLLREGVTGRIVVDVSGRQYFDLESLKGSKDWSRIKSLSKDFSNWIEDTPPASSLLGEREDITLEVPSSSQGSDSGSMIAQINDIITKKVKSMKGEDREIKLVEGAIGALEVRVGVEKFPIDEVPYENIRELIQEAVSQWEKSQ